MAGGRRHHTTGTPEYRVHADQLQSGDSYAANGIEPGRYRAGLRRGRRRLEARAERGPIGQRREPWRERKRWLDLDPARHQQRLVRRRLLR